MVEGWSNTSGTAHVETCCWVTGVKDVDGDRAALGVRVLHWRVDHLRLEGVRRWCNVADLVGDVAGAGLSAVVAGSKGETTPAVGGG